MHSYQTRPRAGSSMDRLKDQLENAEAKCLYCGRKMETILEDLQEGVEQLELTPETEDTVLVALAGLKQVRRSYDTVFTCMSVACGWPAPGYRLHFSNSVRRVFKTAVVIQRCCADRPCA